MIAFTRDIARLARLIVGQADYQDYLKHVRAHDAGTPPMTLAEFYRNREEARYGCGRGRCC
jgi:uncharacterized short protein YbdD (DUF466 family)